MTSGRGSHGVFQRDSIALLLESLQGAAGQAFGMAAVVVVGSEFVVRRPVGEHMVGDDEQAVGHGHDRLLMPTMPQDTAVAGRNGTVLGSSRPERGFDEGRAQPDVALRVFPDLCLPALS